VPAVDVAAHVEHEAVVAGVTPRAHTRESGVGGRAGVALGERAPRDAAVRRGVRRRARRDEEQGAQQHCEHPCEEALHGLLLRRAARAGGVVSDARNRRAVEEEPRRSRFGHLRIVGVRTVAARRRRGRGRRHVRGTASPTLQDAGYRERGPGGGADRRTKTRRTAPERRDEECDVPTLKANELYLTYGDGYVFDGLSIEISSGQPPVGLIGPSGVGKTTLIAALSGQLKPPRGTVTFDGRPVARLRMRSKAEVNARVSAVSQYSMTISDPRMTAERRLRDAMQVARKGGRSHATPLPEMLAAVGLDAEKAYRPMVTLSGGERQRVALAAALATRPEILLLDEPLTALDPNSRGAMARHLLFLNEPLGTVVMLASHDLELVERVCPTVHAMADGRIVATGPLQQILAEAEHPVVKELAEAAPLAVQRFR